MRSLWIQIVLLILYLFLVFFVSRLLDMVLWYHSTIPSTRIVDPLLLSVRQLKQLLENRGVSYTGYVEKRELAQLVEASAQVVQSEVEELSDNSESSDERLPSPPTPSRFRGRLHFYEEVEDTKDSVWLVQVVPADSQQHDAQMDDYSWRVVCNQVAPFAIRTGIFDCKLDKRLCQSKGWHQPLLLLALPKGSKAKDRVVLRTFTSMRPQPIMEWVRDQLSIRVKTIDSIHDLECEWLEEESCNSTTASNSLREVKVLLLTSLLHPPLFLAALSIKFTGRIKFGMFTVKKQDSESLHKKLKHLDYRMPSYLVITPERKVIYGHRRFEHFNFDSMNRFLRAVQPEMNDVFLGSLIVVNMLVTLQIFQVSVQLWWKHLARCLWILISYNFWLFAVWLLILATYRFSAVNYFVDKCLVVVRTISLTELGCLLRTDWQTVSRYPYIFLSTFLMYSVVAIWLLKRHCPVEAEEESESDHPWWEVLPVDSYWINCFFRPMATLSRPLPPSELELEDGIEMLIERLAVPNLWLQPVIPNEYIKELPIWRFRGWESSPKPCSTVEVSCQSPQAIERLMDGEERRISCTCSLDRVKFRQSSDKKSDRCNLLPYGLTEPCNCVDVISSKNGPCEDSGDESGSVPEGMLPTSECAVCLETYVWGSVLCGLPCGHSYHHCCIMLWLQQDNHHCPVCRWPTYKSKHLHRE